jgi:hypothetical protein
MRQRISLNVGANLVPNHPQRSPSPSFLQYSDRNGDRARPDHGPGVWCETVPRSRARHAARLGCLVHSGGTDSNDVAQHGVDSDGDRPAQGHRPPSRSVHTLSHTEPAGHVYSIPDAALSQSTGKGWTSVALRASCKHAQKLCCSKQRKGICTWRFSTYPMMLERENG